MSVPPTPDPSDSTTTRRAPWATGLGGGVLILVLELLVVLVVRRAELAGIWELQNGLVGLGPAWFLLAGAAGAAGGLALGLVRSGSRRARWGLALGLGLFAALVGYGVGGGRHLAELEVRLGFAALVGLGGGAFGFWGAPRVAALLSGKHVRIFVGLAALGVVGLACANHFLLPRLYPAFHAGLAALQCALGGVVLCLLAEGAGFAEGRAARLWAAGGAVLCAAGLVPASRAASGLDNFRWITSEGSPLLAFGVELAAHLAPPPPLETELWNEPLGARRSKGGLDLRGRDLLLVTVDALRTDHVGAYGYPRPTTPSLDALAREGVIFDAAYAATPHTSYSLTSLMTGKYMRPLLLQGAGADSDLWPELLRTYGYRTAGFYPPAVFFIDGERFASFRDRKFGFEYAKIEFAEGDQRVAQVEKYLAEQPKERRVFVWVHLFGPHEPYEQQLEDFGPRDIDRYDSEIHAADHTIGRLVSLFRARDPKSAVIVSADHGEEFGDHGGRYHGTTVYDEQVRVPLVVSVPGVTPGGARVSEPVQTIDLLPTVLGGLRVPIPPRIRGRDLSGVLLGEAAGGPGLALAETERYSLLAEGSYRLICARSSGACQLYDVQVDPGQKKDLSRERREILASLRDKEKKLAASHGQFETRGLRAEGRGWPPALLQALSGDRAAAPEVALLLDDADVSIRRKAAELLFFLRDPEQTGALRLALSREEDPETRHWLALTLTRLGQGAPLVKEVLHGSQPELRRYAALALAEQGDSAGEDELVRWWQSSEDLEFERALELCEALGRIRSKKAVGPLLARLGDVRLRPYIAATLARIGDEDARPLLARALREERYVSARLPLAEALLKLGGKEEIRAPLVRFLGVPDPLEGGIQLALDAGLLEEVGGPAPRALQQLRQLGDSGVQVDVTVPPTPKSAGKRPLRLVLLARSKTGQPGEVRVEKGIPRIRSKSDEPTFRNLPNFSDADQLRIAFVPADRPVQLSTEIPASWGLVPGSRVALEFFVDRHTELLAFVLLPLADELPPPPPEPWERPGEDG